MEVLSILALILLTLVGYSSGVALAGRGEDLSPTLWDLLLPLLLWAAGFYTRELLGRWGAIGLFILAGLLVGYVSGALRRSATAGAIPVSELPEHAVEKTSSSGGLFGRAWRAWSAFALKMGNVQGRILMGFFYFIVVTPFGAGSRLLSDPLMVKQQPELSGWQVKDPLDLTLEEASRQG